MHAWIVGRNLRDIGVGDLSQFYQAHPEFGLKNWPGGGVRKALDGCPNLRWVEGDSNIPGTVSTARIAVVDTWGRLTVQNEAPPLAPGEVRVYDSTPSAQTFFDALRQWMRAKNVSSLDVSGDLSQFYDFHPHLRGVILNQGSPRSATTRGSGLKQALEQCNELRWIDGNRWSKEPARIALVGVQDTRTTPQAYVDALRTWLLERNTFCDVLVSQLHPFYDAYPHFRGQAKKESKKKRCIEGSNVLAWHEGAFTTIALVDSSLPHTPPPEPKKGGVVMDVAAGQLPNAKDEKALVSALRSWIASQGVRDISVGDLGKFFDAHEAFKLKKWPGGGIKKAVKNSGDLLKWYKATAACPAPRIGLGDTAIPSITSTDLCDALKQWLLSTNRSQVNMSELLKFYEAYPQFKNVRFDTETGVLIDKTEGKGSGIKKCLEGYTSLRWCPDQGHGARIELVRNPVENDLVRALHAWLMSHDKTEIGADELEPFWATRDDKPSGPELKKLCENSSLLTWVSD